MYEGCWWKTLLKHVEAYENHVKLLYLQNVVDNPQRLGKIFCSKKTTFFR